MWRCWKRRKILGPKWLDPQSYSALEKILANPTFHPQLVELVDSLRFEPLALPKSIKKIGYIPLIESKELTLCMFYLPESFEIPFHNHPSQHVILKVLRGNALITNCDTNTTCSGQYIFGSQYEILNSSDIQLEESAKNLLLVEPLSNNIHQIRALTDIVFVDLVTPPYDAGEHRITYFSKNGPLLTALRESQVALDMELIDINTLLDNR